MNNDNSNYEVVEENVSDEEWEALLSTMQKKIFSVSKEDIEKRTKQNPVPVNLSDYLNKLLFATIKKLQSFGWELFFIRRSDPNEVLTIMHFPSSGETAVIEKDGSVVRSHDVYIRKAE